MKEIIAFMAEVIKPDFLQESGLSRGHNSVSPTISPGGGGTPIYKPERYVPPQRVSFSSISSLPFWSEIEYIFRLSGSEVEAVVRRATSPTLFWETFERYCRTISCINR